MDRLELGARERALGQQDLAVVARPGGALAGVFLSDLLIEVVQFGPPVEGVGELRLAVELDEEVTLGDRRAGLMSLVMTSDCVLGPESRGAAMVVDSTASTVPLSRTVRTKSWRWTVAVVWRWPDCPDPEFPGSRPRISAAPVATLTTTTATAIHKRE